VIDLRGVPPILIVGGMAVICLGVPIGLYSLFTIGQRTTTREIRREAAKRGWSYKKRPWNFRIEGPSDAGIALSGLAWVMTSSNSGESEMRWSSELNVHFPALAGETDVVIWPRDGKPLPAVALAPAIEARIVKLSRTAGGALQFLRDAHEAPSGVADFDAAYEIRVRPSGPSPIDAALARRILTPPSEAVAPRAVVAWRDPFGFHFNARLPGPPNWATVAWLVDVAVDCAAKLPQLKC
jgi:hypothetical protein